MLFFLTSFLIQFSLPLSFFKSTALTTYGLILL